MGPVLLIVMYDSGTWRVQPGQTLTFGRGQECTIKLPGRDLGLSRMAGSLRFCDGIWWLRNESSSSLLHLSGDRGFRADLPPGMRLPVQEWHAKVGLQGVLADYTLRLRLPDLDDVSDVEGQPGQASGAPAGSPPARTGDHLVTTGDKHPVPSSAHRLRPAGADGPVRGIPQLAARRCPCTTVGKGHRRADRLAAAHGGQALRKHPGSLFTAGRSRFARPASPGGACRTADLDRRTDRGRLAAPARPGSAQLKATSPVRQAGSRKYAWMPGLARHRGRSRCQVP